jgi:hypothetical protein
MSSSDSSGAPGKAVAAEPPIVPTPATSDNGQDDRADGAPADPWFTPSPKSAAAAQAGDESPQWFLRTGRAGLVPDSMTDTWQDGSPSHPDQLLPPGAAGTPPWGAQAADAGDGVPPPWENGPWPGHGDPRPASRTEPVDASRDAVPDVPVAVANLRRRPVQLALAGIGVVVVAVIVIVIVTATSGSPGGGCGTYPAAVRQAYSTAMTDLRTHAPASVQSAAFAQAASRANASAAAAGQIAVRTAMFAMASDMNRAYADVTANRALPATLLQHLTADGTALPASCSG